MKNNTNGITAGQIPAKNPPTPSPTPKIDHISPGSARHAFMQQARTSNMVKQSPHH
ncbi:hypothetical protein K9M47_02230 [Candidatus Gracilibacteria bacterium]|nr:hypothetical protein [Candidatus Gracilibacteria bacterium]MCF7898488.1 hypothetical protein [Candidatus Paceibacterota bacterium]